jgi:26S proteasome regulatory subunit N12
VENTPQRIRPLILGPTPQKNGIFVGMFDTIAIQTPTHRRSALAEVDDNTLQTPSKLASTPSSRDSKLQKTPMSEGKRFFLDQYTTPRKAGGHDETPSSISKKYMTPAFFKKYRDVPANLAGEEPSEPRRAPWKRPKFMRTLSSMIQDLKKGEEVIEEDEDEFDDEMMVLREMEEEESAGGQSLARSKADAPGSATMDRDGFVAAGVREDAPQDKAEDAAKQPVRVYKKKGQKRTTRRVKSRSPLRFRTALTTSVRPTRTAAPALAGETLDDTDERDSEDQAGAKIRVEPAKVQAKSKGGRKKKDLANYCKLKIKNKNSKANGRGFGRRR